MELQRDSQVIFSIIPTDLARERMKGWLGKQADMRKWRPDLNPGQD